MFGVKVDINKFNGYTSNRNGDGKDVPRFDDRRSRGSKIFMEKDGNSARGISNGWSMRNGTKRGLEEEMLVLK